MPSQTLTELFNKIRDDENAHKIVSLLHLMLHMGTKQLESREQSLDPVCALTQELLEQKTIVKNLSELIDQQKINKTSQLEEKCRDMNKQVMDLHKKNLLISEMNKRLYMKCKRLEGEYEELCQSNKSIKEDMKEQRSVMLELQQRLEKLEAKKNTKDDLLDSEDVKEKDVRREVGKPCHPIPMTTEELKEQKAFPPDLQQRFDRSEGMKRQDALLVTKEDNSKPCNGQKKLLSSSKAGKANVTEAEKEKQRKMMAKPHDAPENKPQKKACSATAQEPLKLGNRNKNCNDKVAACSRTSAQAKQVSNDNSVGKPRNPTLKVWRDQLTNEKKPTPDIRKPRVNLGPNLRDTKPVKVPLRLEKKEPKLPPIVNKNKTTPFHKPCVKQNVLPGRVIPNRCRTTVTNAVQASRGMSLKKPVQPQTTARTRTLKCPPVEKRAFCQYTILTGANTSPEMAATETVIVGSISPLPPVKRIRFKKDEDFSSWKHDSFSDSFGRD